MNPCETCDGRGILGRDENREWLFCGECEMGLRLELSELKTRLDLFGQWLADNEDSPLWRPVVGCVKEVFGATTARYDEVYQALGACLGEG